ncbi:helix-turn-helix domain-containing protein [Streptomyces sp. NPDC059122]
MLILPVKGAFDITAGRITHRLRPGAVLRIPPGHPYWIGAPVQPWGELEWMILHYDPSPAGSALTDAIEILATSPGMPVWQAPDHAAERWGRAFDLAQQERDWISDSLLQHTLTESVLLLLREFTAAQAPVSASPHPGIAQALAWIEDHINQPCGIAELASVAGLSTSRFHEAFRAETGTTPKDFVLRRKIDRARTLLEGATHYSVTEVACLLGFSSSQYFATVFRRYQGIPPSQLRHSPRP